MWKQVILLTWIVCGSTRGCPICLGAVVETRRADAYVRPVTTVAAGADLAGVGVQRAAHVTCKEAQIDEGSNLQLHYFMMQPRCVSSTANCRLEADGISICV